MTSNTLSLEKIAARIRRPGPIRPAVTGNPRRSPKPVRPNNNAPLRGAQNAPAAPEGLVPARSGPAPAPSTRNFVRPEDTANLQQSISNIADSFNPRRYEVGPVVNGLQLNKLDDMAWNDMGRPFHATPGARQGVLPGFESYMVAKDFGGGPYPSYPANPIEQFTRKYFASEPYLSQDSLTPVKWRGASIEDINNAIATPAQPAPAASFTLPTPSQPSRIKRVLPTLVGAAGAGALGRAVYNNLTDSPAPTPGGAPAPTPTPGGAPAPAGQPQTPYYQAPAPALMPPAPQPSPFQMQAPYTGINPIPPMLY